VVNDRVAAALNRALHAVFEDRPELMLLGQDVADPYGGAFSVTRGLSTKHPDRVLNTPISENGVMGVANGLALCGNQVIVEVMFGDFLTLGLDQLVNFATKAVSMYGRTVPMRLLVRCAVGGGRGYGPTHSQSPRKLLVGTPNLTLYELSPFHDPELLVAEALDRGEPAVLFEDKVLYTTRVCRDGHVDDRWEFGFVGDDELGWAHVRPIGRPVADVLVVAPGGVAHRACDAARTVLDQDGIVAHVLVPARLFPLDLDPLSPLLSTGLVVVADEGTEGGSWGTELAHQITQRAWHQLRAPVRLVTSRASVIPAAPHLERTVLVSAEGIAAGIREVVSRPSRVPITLPRLNANAETYVVCEWLSAHGERVRAGQPVVSVETSKAVQEVLAPGAGVLHRLVDVGAECPVGTELGYLTDLTDQPAGDVVPLGRVQRDIAEVVTRAHAQIPTAFTVVRTVVDDALNRLDALSEQTGATVGLPELLVKVVAEAHATFPTLFGSLLDVDSVAIPARADVGVTLDCGNGLFVPVVRDAARRSMTDVADELMDFRLKAARNGFAPDDLAGGNITLSLNTGHDVVLAQPIVKPPQLCAVSVGAVRTEVVLDQDGSVRGVRVLNIGLAYDHRVVNGAEAAEFLGFLKNMIEDWSAFLE